MQFMKNYMLRGQSWRRGTKCDCKTDCLWVRSPLEEMKYLLKHAMPPESGRKWGMECLNTRFPLPTLLCAGYSVKLIYLIYLFISLALRQKAWRLFFYLNRFMLTIYFQRSILFKYCSYLNMSHHIIFILALYFISWKTSSSFWKFICIEYKNAKTQNS